MSLSQTTVNLSEVRPATTGDVPDIHRLLQFHARKGNLLPRPLNELYRNMRDFFVIEIDGKLRVCAALEIFTSELAEVRSLAVEEDYAGTGLGRKIVTQIMREAQDLGLIRLMALTYVPEFFHKIGFKTVAKETLPEKVWGVCVKCYKFHDCDETAVLRQLNNN
ncbi:N-acetyltransferase [Pseudomonadota bacterium]